jgi:SAM-dependent methyltransferase
MAQAIAAFRPDVPSTARMYDYYLGGKDNYPADRAAAERIISMMPAGVVRTSAVQNRKFLLRVVRHLTKEMGVRQFLDIGTGLPAMNSVHQIAQSIEPESRIVYVDHDPIVLAHSRNLLHGNDRTAIIQRDLRDPAGLLADQELHALLDFSQPVAVLLVAVLHFLADAEDPYGIVATLMDPMPPGSYLVISHFTADGYAQADVAAQEYQNATSALHSRTWTQVGRFFADHQLLPPGKVVWTPQWTRPGDEPEDDPDVAAHPGRALVWCGVARKTGPARAEALPAPANQASEASRGSGAQASRGPSAPARIAGGSDATASSATHNGAALRPDIPNVARMYDFMLGGKDNYPADRAAATRTFAVLGEDVVRGTVLQNRQFLGRAVRYLAADQDIRQFLDIGAGLPSMNSVHEITCAVAPDSRVVYVDNDPVVLAHARDLLNGVPGTLITDHDLRDPGTILGDPRIRSVLDFDRPIAVLLVAILHFLADADDPAGVVATLMAALPPGSCLAISHLTADHYAHADRVAEVYADTTAGLHLRTRAEIEAFFCGLPLLPPGALTYTGSWHPDPDTAPPSAPGGSSIWCGIARKLRQRPSPETLARRPRVRQRSHAHSHCFTLSSLAFVTIVT